MYIYYKDYNGSNNWGQFKKITASNAIPGGKFGFSVSISGNILVVHEAKNYATPQIYIFYKDHDGPDNWGEVKIITQFQSPPFPYGDSVSIYGNIIAATEFYGATQNNVYLYGSVYLYYKDEGGPDNWGLKKRIDGPTYQTYLGGSVSLKEDQLIVGAFFANNRKGNAFI